MNQCVPEFLRQPGTDQPADLAFQAKEYDVHYLLSDFKKKNGYQRSVELSHEYGMYRQDYCGCVFSMRERERVRKEQTER